MRVSQLFLAGVMAGGAVLTAIFLAIILIHAGRNLQSNPTFNEDFPMWKGLIFIIFYIWALGVNIYIYEKHNIDYRTVL